MRKIDLLNKIIEEIDKQIRDRSGPFDPYMSEYFDGRVQGAKDCLEDLKKYIENLKGEL